MVSRQFLIPSKYKVHGIAQPTGCTESKNFAWGIALELRTRNIPQTTIFWIIFFVWNPSLWPKKLCARTLKFPLNPKLVQIDRYSGVKLWKQYQDICSRFYTVRYSVPVASTTLQATCSRFHRALPSLQLSAQLCKPSVHGSYRALLVKDLQNSKVNICKLCWSIT